MADQIERHNDTEPLRVYWQPGCTGCLRMKEFLIKHGVEFISINVLTDPEACEELEQLAGRRIPIARRGNDWVDGQVLGDLARIAGIPLDAAQGLTALELVRRIDIILSAAERLSAQLPQDALDRWLPDRPRRYRDLVAHIAQIVDAFLDHDEFGRRVEIAVYEQTCPAHITSGAELTDYVAATHRRFNTWRTRHSAHRNYSAPADIYYGKQTLREFLERTAWHAAQHSRQLQLVVENLGIEPNGPLTEQDLAGLPMPAHVWDNELAFTSSGMASSIV